MSRVNTLFVLLTVAITVPACTDSSGPIETAVTRVAVAFYVAPSLKVLDSSGVPTAVVSCGARCRIRNVEWSEDGEMLAMTANLDSASVLLVANRDGSGLREVARVPAAIIPGPKGTTSLQFSDFQQAWSSDNRLAYVNDGLVSSAADGTWRRTLRAGVAILRPRWAPRDSGITYINGASSQLEIIRVDGSNNRPLVTLPHDVTGQVWSPDGSTLAISTHEAGEGPLYLLDSRTLGVRAVGAVPYASSYCWSPDSRSLAFVHAERAPISNNQTMTASIIRLDGSNLVHMASIPTYVSNRVSWSSNGQSLLFLSSDPQFLPNSLYVGPISRAGVRRFTTEESISYFSVSGVRCSYLFNL